MPASSAPARQAAPDPAAAAPPDWSRQPPPEYLAPIQPFPGYAAPPSSVESRWYGWQTLIADGVTLTLVGVSVATEKDALAWLGAFTLAAPAVHWSHGHVGKGFGSFALRTLPPIMGAAMLLGGDSESGGSGNATLGALLLVAWIPTAVVVDAAVLGYEDVPTRGGFSWAPTLSPARDGATIGAAGSF